MQQVLQVVLNDLGVEVVQVQTHAGYAYHLDMAAPLDTPLGTPARVASPAPTARCRAGLCASPFARGGRGCTKGLRRQVK